MAVNIEVYKQNSIGIESDDRLFFVDPYKIDHQKLGRFGRGADLVFITHRHQDHFSRYDIEMVAGYDSCLVVPKNLVWNAVRIWRGKESNISHHAVVFANQTREINGIRVTGVPAYNILKPFHPRFAGGLGYIIETGGKRIYIAGDTDATREAKAVKCDIALVPIGGIYTMNAKQAAKLINIIKPEMAIPTHYDKPEIGEEFKKLVDPSIKVQLKMIFE